MIKLMEVFSFLCFCSTIFSLFINSSSAADTLSANQTLRDGDTIVSAGGNFELGFVNPNTSPNRYLAIWYKRVATGSIIWVANREVPLTTKASVLKFNGKGSLQLLNGTDGAIWTSNSSRSVKNPVGQLLDTGNFVVRDGSGSDPEKIIWQSFDYPGPAFLPGMKFGWDLDTGLERSYNSWKSVDDPSPGEYTNHIDPNGFPQMILRKGSIIQFRAGPWNGARFSGMPNLRPNPIYSFDFVFNDKEMYYHYDLINKSVVTRMLVMPNGQIQRFTWIERSQIWQLYLTVQMDDCDRYALCGAYGSCNINNSPACGCLKGFVPNSSAEWDIADWTSGCVRKTPLKCADGEGFVKHPGVKLPDTQWSWFNKSMNLEECEKVCLRNCSCTAYANTDIRDGGSGCLLWFGDLLDIREHKENGQDLYIRMAASELGTNRRARANRIRIILIPTLVVIAVLLCLFLCVLGNRKKKREGIIRLNLDNNGFNEDEREDLELPLFDFATIAQATNNFSMNSKLGEGGYGPVYKGMLDGEQEIAVKRLSKDSRQGLGEFTNEVSCIAKLQHRNLVKLLGCCIEEGERMLIYEYMPNKSLDSFIFDKEQGKSLDWSKRYNIIKGIARGLLYLHQDSRLRIIHRDLKVSNILLDDEMNPKISDFGMARIFGGSETAANTTRVVGTYGYMSPEYAIDGLFSTKSDVYSFGVLVLEIISGQRNRGFYHTDHNLNLLGHAWRIYKEGKLWELIDKVIMESSNEYEVYRVIQIGLLCVQRFPEDRPSMSSVVLMLSSEIDLPQPKEPGFFMERKLHEGYSSSSKHDSSSSNHLTVTCLAPR